MIVWLKHYLVQYNSDNITLDMAWVRSSFIILVKNDGYIIKQRKNWLGRVSNTSHPGPTTAPFALELTHLMPLKLFSILFMCKRTL